MKFLVLCTGRPRGICEKTIRLAEFLGIFCEPLSLPDGQPPAEFVSTIAAEPGAAIVLHPATLEERIGEEGIAGFAAAMVTQFRRIIVLGLRPCAFDSALVRAFSSGQLAAVQSVPYTDAQYTFSADSQDLCEAFSGLSFGPVLAENDCIFVPADGASVRAPISIGGLPFMAMCTAGAAEILFIGSEAVVDLDEAPEQLHDDEHFKAPLTSYFSRLMPQAMAFRYFAGARCWRPKDAYAAIIVDDPLLARNYGYLNYDRLLADAMEHNFHAAIAFIPHNFRRHSPRVLRMFRQHPERLSICFHGNDHTDAEFAASSHEWLNTLLAVAEDRIRALHKTTGLACDRVMVFPQGKFSPAAMQVLKAHNFFAAVNTTPVPLGESASFTFRELAAPAILRHSGFPLFLRSPIGRMEPERIAFNLFFGRPNLVVVHHDIFKRPEAVRAVADRINSMCPRIRWRNLATIATHSTLVRAGMNDEVHIRAYSGSVRVENKTNRAHHYRVQWPGSLDRAAVAQVLVDGKPAYRYEVGSNGIEFSLELPASGACTVAIDYRNPLLPERALSIRWNLRAFLRRRLSEFRDNYLSKNERCMAGARSFQRRFLKL